MPILLYFVGRKCPSGNCYVSCFLTDKTAMIKTQSDKITKQQYNFLRMILPRYGWRVCPVSAPPLFSSPWTCWDLIFAALASKNTRKIPTLKKKKKNRFGFVVGQQIEKKIIIMIEHIMHLSGLGRLRRFSASVLQHRVKNLCSF